VLSRFEYDQGIGIWGWFGVDGSRRREIRTGVETRYSRESGTANRSINVSLRIGMHRIESQ